MFRLCGYRSLPKNRCGDTQTRTVCKRGKDKHSKTAEEEKFVCSDITRGVMRAR